MVKPLLPGGLIVRPVLGQRPAGKPHQPGRNTHHDQQQPSQRPQPTQNPPHHRPRPPETARWSPAGRHRSHWRQAGAAPRAAARTGGVSPRILITSSERGRRSRCLCTPPMPAEPPASTGRHTGARFVTVGSRDASMRCTPAGMGIGGLRLAIDYGTTTTVAVLAWPEGRHMPLLFDGSAVLPSAVHTGPDGRLLTGTQAWQAAATTPEGFQPTPLRHIRNGTIDLGSTKVDVLDAIAATLRRVADEAARLAGQPVPDVRLVVPAGWRPRRRTLLRNAAHRAGLPTPTLIEAPIAAAHHLLATGTPIADGAHLLICDLGAGFEATVLRHTGDSFDVLATIDDPDAGTLRIDRDLAAYLTDVIAAAGNPPANPGALSAGDRFMIQGSAPTAAPGGGAGHPWRRLPRPAGAHLRHRDLQPRRRDRLRPLRLRPGQLGRTRHGRHLRPAHLPSHRRRARHPAAPNPHGWLAHLAELPHQLHPVRHRRHRSDPNLDDHRRQLIHRTAHQRRRAPRRAPTRHRRHPRHRQTDAAPHHRRRPSRHLHHRHRQLARHRHPRRHLHRRRHRLVAALPVAPPPQPRPRYGVERPDSKPWADPFGLTTVNDRSPRRQVSKCVQCSIPRRSVPDDSLYSWMNTDRKSTRLNSS